MSDKDELRIKIGELENKSVFLDSPITIEVKSEFNELAKIKRIGKETIKDIERVYSSIDDLKKALVNNSVPLRNDIVKILREELLKGGDN